jgi:integrase/recombinase XerD
MVGAFLNHLENDPGNTVRTRNARLAAIHSLFQDAALRHPEHAANIQRVLAIPPKRYDKALITYLTEEEITALLAALDLTAWTGRRDQALLMLACQTGLRATELTTLAISDMHLGTGARPEAYPVGSVVTGAAPPPPRAGQLRLDEARISATGWLWRRGR